MVASINLDGTVNQMYQLDSSKSTDKVGHSSLTINTDSNGNLYGGIYFLHRAV